MGMAMGRAIAIKHLCILCLYIPIISLQKCSASDTLTRRSSISVGQTLISSNQVFELGFFSPGNSSKQYIGIWYKNIPTVVWVANRENPLSVSDNFSSLTIGDDGNLRLLDGNKNTVWSSNVSGKFNNTIAVLTGNGNLVLNDTNSELVLWESFDYPGDSLLSGMTLGMNGKTQGKQILTSWKSDDDPAPGKFVVGLSPEQPPQAFNWNGSKPYWRSGPWNGAKFIGIPDEDPGYSNGISVTYNTAQGATLTAYNDNSSDIVQFVLTPDGAFKIFKRDEGNDKWDVTWRAPENPCDVYGVCGSFAICRNNTTTPICDCLEGFVPQSNEEWSKSNWTMGCVRQIKLPCEKNGSYLASVQTKVDKFVLVKGIKLPDHYYYLPNMDITACQQWCSGNCSCKAYAFVEGINCMVWIEDLVDIEQFTFAGEDLFLRLVHTESETKKAKLLISLTTLAGVLLICGTLYKWITNKKGGKRKLMPSNLDAEIDSRDSSQEDVIKQESYELPIFDFKQVVAATDNFSHRNKLGGGGFGPVYKGMLDHGQEVAVKRLSSHSGQGVKEFKNEIALISKLQHRNLVKLLGCCIEGEERILIYEYMRNKSLDNFLFDPKKRLQLDWATRFKIIQGIGRGLLYLHRDSCLRIIHRDLKSSNILLDNQMNPKISDFGLARTFQMTQELENTRRIVGTYGYMSPEYAMGGVISEKSDVFSYGVMLLEILSGIRNTSFIHNEHIYLLGYAWKLWNEGKATEFIDEALAESYCPKQWLRCIHVGLLCVQDFADDRPTMSEVVFMLNSGTDLRAPKQPLFTLQRASETDIGLICQNMCSLNDVTMSIIGGR